MQTIAKSSFVQPRFEPRLFLTHTEPKTVKQTLLDHRWKAAMQVQFDALQQNKTWTVVPLPPNRQAIGCKGSLESGKTQMVVLTDLSHVWLL